MKLLRFPALIQRKLCGLLSPTELIFLSFCSIRTCQTIKIVNPNKKKKEVWVSGSIWCMSFSLNNSSDFLHLHCEHPSRMKKNLIEIEVDGIKFRISYKIKKFGSPSVIFYDTRQFTSIHHYICDLLNAPKEFYVIFYRTESEFPTNLPIRKSLLCDSNHTLRDIESFYKSYPGHHFSEVKYSIKPYRWNSYYREMIFNVQNLLLREYESSAWGCYTKFKGENGYFQGVWIFLSCLNDILKDWMEETGGELKTLIFEAVDVVKVKEIKQKLKVFVSKETDAPKRERFYPYKSPISQHHSIPSDMFDCSDGIDIRRKTDQKLCTIKVTPHYAAFFVWD